MLDRVGMNQGRLSIVGLTSGALIATGLTVLTPEVTAAKPRAQVSSQTQRVQGGGRHARHTSADARARMTGTDARPQFSKGEQDGAGVPGIPDARFWADSVQSFIDAVPREPGEWLVLSEGGEDGAFGAGVLAGWTKTGARPPFSLVTGVSTGALMAPFAFLGSAYDDRLRELYLTVTAADIFEAGATNRSLLDTWPLAASIERNVDAKLLAEIAAEHRRGRRLLVVTTNLDAGRPVAWNMGAIAEHGSAALPLFRQVLLASASIPGVFPPVMLNVEANGRRFHEMHVDGGTTGPFYVAPQKLLLGAVSDRLPARQIHIIINSKLTSEFQRTEVSTLKILGRSISVALQSALRAQIAAVLAKAKHDGIGIVVASVDQGFSHDSRGAFDPEYMKALFELGFEQGNKTALRGEPVPAPVHERGQDFSHQGGLKP